MSLAVALSAAFTWACVAVVLACFSTATTPARIGVAAEVPESLLKYPVKWLIEQKSGLFGSSAAGPRLLYPMNCSFLLTAPTVITRGCPLAPQIDRPGPTSGPQRPSGHVSPQLPAANSTSIPALIASTTLRVN